MPIDRMDLHRTGFTRLQVIIGVAVVLVVIGLSVAVVSVVAILTSSQIRKHSRQVRDASNLKQIGFGLVAESMATKNGFANVVGGAKDHGEMWGALLRRNLLTPNALISPAEENPKVVAYSGAQTGSGFFVDLAVRSNTSYAALPIDASPRWKSLDTRNQRKVMLGTRGNPDRVAPSGVIMFQDMSLEFTTPSAPSGTLPMITGLPGSAGPVLDNLFRNDTMALPAGNASRGGDAFLVLQKAAAASGAFLDEKSPEVSWD